MDTLRGISAKGGINTDTVMNQIKVQIDRNIYGELPMHGKIAIGNRVYILDNLIHGINTFTTNAAMGLAPALAVKNFLASQIKMWSNAYANSWAGNDWFGAEEIQEAVAEYFVNSQKISNINLKYKIVALSERDIMQHALYNRTKRHATDSDMIMAAHFAGDYVNKLIGMTAQMIKDGTYYAHDDQGNYNPKNDKRFYRSGKELNWNNITENGKLLMEDIKDNLIVERLHGQHLDQNGPLKAAYFSKQTKAIRILNSRLVSEITDPEFKNVASAHAMVKIAMSLKNYMWNVAQEWVQNPHYEESIGAQKVVTIDGKKKVVWEPELVEGVLNTILSSAKLMHKYSGDPKKTWDEMSNYQKRNMTKLLAFSIAIGGIAGLVAMLLAGYDDEEVSSPMQAVNKAIVGAQKEALVQVNPMQLYIDWKRSATPVFVQAENFFNGFVATLLLPFAAANEGIAQSLDDWAYDNSKNIIGGAGYRDTRRFFGDWIDSLLARVDN